MIKLQAIDLLGMCFPQDRPSKLNHCLTEIQALGMLQGALAEIPDEETIGDLLHKRVLQVVQNRKNPRTAQQWIGAYATCMNHRIIGENSIQYCIESGNNALAELGLEWMVTTPAEAVQEEMECWDD